MLYINDINQSISSKCKLYADDTALYRNINNINDGNILQNDLNEILNWSKLWLMEFNIDKCFVMHINKRKNHTYTNVYTMDNKTLKNVENTEYLGVQSTPDYPCADYPFCGLSVPISEIISQN